MNFINDLNPEQKRAVIATEGPIMVIAGAGSGKTRVLTYKIAYLIKKGIDPFNILALTFTNKAAREMKNRIENLILSNEVKNLWMGTFHSIFAKVLRIEGEKIGFLPNFSIYDTQDSKRLLKSILKEMNLDDKIYNIGTIFNRISLLKNNLISWRTYKNRDDLILEDQNASRPAFCHIYEQYQKELFKANAMDFDDILFYTYELFKNDANSLYKYQHKFKYILIDEYQDTNNLQYLIIKKLAAAYENICVVGDDAQSIYAFRGANINNILNFRNDYPDAKIFKLEQNYRSTKTIVNVANSIIAKNIYQIKKKVWTNNEIGNKVVLLKNKSESDEAHNIATIISDIYKKEGKYGNIAILYRTNAQSRILEEAMRKSKIPYKIYGGMSFYQKKEIKDVLAYFRLVVNNNDIEALRRIINFPARGIGDTTVERIFLAAKENNISVWEAISNIDSLNINLKSGIKKNILDFYYLIKSFSVQSQNSDAYDIGERIVKSSGILKLLYEDRSIEGITRYENVQELLNGLKEFSESKRKEQRDKIPLLSEYLQEVSLLTSLDDDINDNDRILMMTVHSAKGLEFPYVFIVGLEENLFPSQMSLQSRSGLEEERRLFYVAVTRAQKQVFLSYASTRYKFGSLKFSEPSRFIDEIDSHFLQCKYLTKNPTKNINSNNTTINEKDLKKIVAGVKVKHNKFGYGKVLSVEGNYPHTKATVFFQSVGQKQLLLRFAKLELDEN